jgi:hypothetical protein
MVQWHCVGACNTRWCYNEMAMTWPPSGKTHKHGGVLFALIDCSQANKKYSSVFRLKKSRNRPQGWHVMMKRPDSTANEDALRSAAAASLFLLRGRQLCNETLFFGRGQKQR